MVVETSEGAVGRGMIVLNGRFLSQRQIALAILAVGGCLRTLSVVQLGAMDLAQAESVS